MTFPTPQNLLLYDYSRAHLVMCSWGNKESPRSLMFTVWAILVQVTAAKKLPLVATVELVPLGLCGT